MNKTNTIIVIIVVIIIGIGAVIYFMGCDSDTNTNNSTVTTTNTSTVNTIPAQNSNQEIAAPVATANQYDGQTINISSTDGKIEGLAGVKYTEFEGDEYILVGFFFKIHDAFSQKSRNIGSTTYSLVANHIKSTETRVNDGTVTKGTNMLGGIYCEKDFVPDIFEITAGNSYDQTIGYIDCTWGTNEAWADTDSFYYLYTKAYSIDTFTLEDIYELNKLEIYDGSQHWVKEVVDGLDSAGLDTAAAYASAPIVATYTLEYEEQ
ncbi:MAG: hypothetical protein V1853_04660 [bacterium]